MENKEIIQGNVALLKEVIAELAEQKIAYTPEIAVAVLQEVTKDKRMFWIDEHRPQTVAAQHSTEPATDKQIAFLAQKGIDAKGMSKAEAHAKIDSIIKKH